MIVHPFIPRLLALALAAGSLGCAGDGPAGPAETRSGEAAAIRVTANVAGTPIATLVVEVTATDIAVPLVFNLAVDAETEVASGTVRVPPGDARTFELTAFDDQGTVTHQGSATADIRPGQNPPIQMKLGPRSGQVPVTVSFGSYSVIVTPGTAELALGETVQLVAEVLDENGATVGDVSALQWATSAPWSVTVDANGLVAGVAPGEASVVATFEGVAGLAAVVVAGGESLDLDADGFSPPADCDDSDMTVHPGAAETVDGKDNDCDGAVDNTVAAGMVYVQDQQSLMVFRAGGPVDVAPACPGLFGPLSGPDHSPDGTRAAVASATGLWIVEHAGSCTQLTTDPTDVDPDWAPGGETLAFTRPDFAGVAVIWTVSASGTGAAPLLDGKQPAWSPDGSKLAFVNGQPGRIHVANADGSSAALLTPNSNTSGEWDPAWSPDGARIAFRWGCLDQATEGCALTDFAEIYVINADGTGQVQLTDTPGDNYEPAWSPDGARIAYINTEQTLAGGFIHIRSSDGTGLSTPYTAAPGQRHPTWASSATYP